MSVCLRCWYLGCLKYERCLWGSEEVPCWNVLGGSFKEVLVVVEREVRGALRSHSGAVKGCLWKRVSGVVRIPAYFRFRCVSKRSVVNGIVVWLCWNVV